jgi:hemolysin D
MKALAMKDVALRYWRIGRLSWTSRHSLDPVRRTREELAFQPAVIELVDSPASPLPYRAMRLIMALVAIAIVWAAFGRLDIVANANGKVVTDTRTKTVESLETALVRHIFVRDGQAVKKGQGLVELDAVGVRADVDRAKDGLFRARLNAERAAVTAAALDGDTPPVLKSLTGVTADELAEANRLSAAQYEAFRRKTAGLRASIDEKQAELRTAQGSVPALREYAKISVDRVADYQRLLGKNYVSREEYLMREQERITAQRDLKTQEDRLRELAAGIDIARQDLAAAASETRRQLLDDERTAREQMGQLTTEADRAAERGASMQLVSPVDGTVQQLAAHTLGGVVAAAQPIMSIVPDDESIEVEATILNQDIGFVRPGQAVVAKVESFPYTQYGYLDADVVSVSHDAVSDEKLGLVFPARIRLRRATMDVDGVTIRLTPGMALNLEIKTGKRTVLAYLLDPLRAQVHEGLGER